jgi:hypothetical protein
MEASELFLTGFAAEAQRAEQEFRAAKELERTRREATGFNAGAS